MSGAVGLKPAYYLLAVVLLLVAGLVAFISMGAGVKPRSVVAPVLREVYVDLDTLVYAHPAYRALGMLAQSAVPQSPLRQASRRPVFAAIQFPQTDGVFDGTARQQLEAAIARVGVSALSRLEVVRTEGLDARLRLKRTDMIQQSAAQTEADLHEIERQRSAALRQAANSTAFDRINYMVRIAVLKSQTNVPTLDKKSVNVALASEKDQLGMLEDKRATQRREIENEFRTKIQEQARATEAKISEAVSAFEKQGMQQIEDDIKQARSGLLSDLSERSGYAGHVAEEKARSLALAAAEPLGVCGSGVTAGRTIPPAGRVPLAVMRADLRESVARAIEAIAEQEGLKVVFSRKNGATDETAMMLRLMRERAWGAFRGAGGS